MKKALKIIWKISVSLAALLLGLWILIQTPGVQTFAARKVTASLEKNLGGRIEFSKIHFKPFNALVLKDFALIDENPPVTASGETLDTLAKAKSLSASFSLKGLFKKEGIHLGKVSLEDASFTLVIEPDGTNISRFFPKGSKEKDDDKEMGNLFDARRVQLEDFRFRMVNTKKQRPAKDYGIDWFDLDILVSSLNAHDLSLADGYMKGVLDNLVMYEKSGYHVSSLSGSTTVGHGRTEIKDLHIKDSWSDISMSEFALGYRDTKAFGEFLDEVRISGSIRKSRIDFKSLSYFSPSLRKMDVCFDVDRADVDGPVSNLGIDGIRFSEAGSKVSGYAEGRISGLPDIRKTTLDFNVDDLSFTSDGLGRFIRGFAPSARMDLGKYAPDAKLSFDGKVSGILDNLSVDGKVSSNSIGGLRADIRMKDLLSGKSGRDFSGKVVTEGLDLGRITGISKLGPVTMRSVLDASLGKEGASIRIDSLFIDKLHALDYDYSNIIATGTYTDKTFDGRLVCNDPNLNLLFQGIFTLSDKTSNGLYKFFANVGYADLQALGFDKRGVSKVSGRIDANYMKVGSGDLIGNLGILGLDLENSLGRYDIGDIRITSHSNSDLKRINLNSSFADASFVGSKQFTDLLDDLKQLTVLKELPVLCKDTLKTWDGERYDVRLDVHDARDILSFVMPGLYVADSTKARLSVSRNGDVTASLKSSRIAMGKNYLRNLDLVFDNKGGSLNGAVSGSELSVAGLSLKNDNLSLYASDNHAGIGYSFDNNSDLANSGEMYFSGEFDRSGDGRLIVHGKVLPSSLWFNDQEWLISQSSVESLGKDILIDNLSAVSGSQSIKLDGGFSTSKEDTLSVDLVRYDLGLVNKLSGKDYGLEGLVTGRALVTSPWKGNAGLDFDMVCDSVKLGGKPMGRLSLTGDMDKAGKVLLTARNVLDGITTIDVSGSLDTRDDSMDILADLSGMDVGYATPFISSVFSEMDGWMSGKVRVKGKGNSLSVSGTGTTLENVLLRVAFTDVPYIANGPFSIDDKGIHLDGIAVKDMHDGTGTISGGILYDHLKDIRMDTRISMNRMEAIDIKESAGEAIYGNVFASGNVSIKGPFNAIRLEVDARTDKNGNIHIPIDKTSTDANTNLLTFKEPYKEVYIDPYELMMNRLETGKKKESDFGIHLKIAANQRTEASVEIDRVAGNVLTGRGQGNIDIHVRPSSNLFRINGDYTLNSGNFHFNAMDIAQKDFSILQGSSVRFNGDVMDSDLDIKGVYTTKASVATLIADTTSLSTRKIVNCGIGITGKIREPKLDFSIEVPDLDPMTKSKVESALNTEDKVQRQFISLLISGGFMPEEQSGIVNNNTALYSNLADIMASQLNNILQKLDIPLDFGLNYQSSQSGTNIFDVAVTTQLFNNRVIVNGNVGNREYGNSAQGDVVGDLDIEIKLDKPGQVRLTMFSHSADDYTNFLDNTQRNGAGITYQKEFDTFEDLIKSIFTSRKKRQERAAAAAAMEKEMNTMTIDK